MDHDWTDHYWTFSRAKTNEETVTIGGRSHIKVATFPLASFQRPHELPSGKL